MHETNTPGDLAALITLAMKASAAHQPEVALAHLQSAVTQFPDDFTGWYLYAAELAAADNTNGALAAFTRAGDLAPDHTVCRFQHGLLLLTLGRDPEAVALLSPLLDLPEAHYMNRFGVALTLISQHHPAAAEMPLRQGLAANAELPDLNRDMTILLQRVLAAANAEESHQSQEQHGIALDSAVSLPREVLIRGYGKAGPH